jgi:hypothetical protein
MLSAAEPAVFEILSSLSGGQGCLMPTLCMAEADSLMDLRDLCLEASCQLLSGVASSSRRGGDHEEVGSSSIELIRTGRGRLLGVHRDMLTWI